MSDATKTSIAMDNWDQHWTEFSEAPDYSPAVSYRRRIIRRMLEISPDTEGRRLVELGCGTGQFAGEFCPQFPLVKFLGLDISQAGVERARLRIPAARFEVCDLLQPVENETLHAFQATDAVCSEVLEHVQEPQRILTNASVVMAPGCRLLVTVPGGPMNAFDKHIGHRRHYRPSELAALLTSAGYHVEKASGIGFPFYNLYRAVLLLSGSSVVKLASGPPSVSVRAAYHFFDSLCRLNLDRWGWQTIAVARWPGKRAA
ncbi:MAG TPA: class I SAM-dependent methyltransferase [Terriglobales bacterium]|nr:class I SAM-dependent methyltransferase [Terriglobales bacterium]